MRKVLFALLVVGTMGSRAARADVTGDANRIYNVMAAVPVAERHVLFRNLTPELKSALWTLHLRQFLNDPRLSAEQRELVAEAIPLLNPTAYEQHCDAMAEDLNEPLNRLQESVRSLFPRELATIVFSNLGAPDADALNATAQLAQRLPHVVQSEGRPLIVLEAQDCTCSRASDWCWWGTICTGSPCYPVSGCGFGWRYQCTNYCETPYQ